jgi:hypothetical protein
MPGTIASSAAFTVGPLVAQHPQDRTIWIDMPASHVLGVNPDALPAEEIGCRQRGRLLAREGFGVASDLNAA